jgi:hypothetical protein
MSDPRPSLEEIRHPVIREDIPRRGQIWVHRKSPSYHVEVESAWGPFVGVIDRGQLLLMFANELQRDYRLHTVIQS